MSGLVTSQWGRVSVSSSQRRTGIFALGGRFLNPFAGAQGSGQMRHRHNQDAVQSMKIPESDDSEPSLCPFIPIGPNRQPNGIQNTDLRFLAIPTRRSRVASIPNRSHSPHSLQRAASRAPSLPIPSASPPQRPTPRVYGLTPKTPHRPTTRIIPSTGLKTAPPLPSAQLLIFTDTPIP